MKHPEACLQIFARAPIAGHVKTRLIPALGADGAAQLHTQLSRDILSMATTANLCPVELWCSPDTEHRFFAECRTRYPLTLRSQTTGDIGDKMKDAAMSALAHHRYVVIIGTDCPALCSEDISEALQTLRQGFDVCLKPAEDGGYVLIAMRRRIDAVFDDIPWGTCEVMPATRQRLDSLSVAYHELRTTWDLDRPDDLVRYEQLCGSVVDRQCG